MLRSVLRSATCLKYRASVAPKTRYRDHASMQTLNERRDWSLLGQQCLQKLDGERAMPRARYEPLERPRRVRVRHIFKNCSGRTGDDIWRRILGKTDPCAATLHSFGIEALITALGDTDERDAI